MRATNLVLSLSILALSHSVFAAEAGDKAPAFSAYEFSGEAVSFPDNTSNKTSVVVFWATWCGYCKAFMPYLAQIESDYRDQGVQVVTINAKEDGSGDPAAYIGNLGFPMIAIKSGNAIARAYDVEFIPGLLIVDADGMVAYRRPWTDLPAGQEVAELWDGQVREALNALAAN